MNRCFWEGVAVEVRAKASEDFKFVARPELGFAGRYRVKVPYWYDCRERSKGLGVSQMACQKEGQAFSLEFTVRSP